MRDKIAAVKVVQYPVLNVVFADGMSGNFDVGKDIARFEMFAPLKEKVFFSKVSVDHDGYRLGWRLDEVGNEIDYGSDTIRSEIETAKVIEMAEQYRAKIQAAE
jgi:Protein of unknown function (DUF2442)